MGQRILWGGKKIKVRYMDTPEQHTDLLSSNVTLKCSKRKDYFFCSCLVIFYSISLIYWEWLVGICTTVHFVKMWTPHVYNDEFCFLDFSTSKLSGILPATCPPSYIMSLLILCRSSWKKIAAAEVWSNFKVSFTVTTSRI